MQDNPEIIQLLRSEETDETPNWVSDAGIANWQPPGQYAGRPECVSEETDDSGRMTRPDDARLFGQARDYGHRFYGSQDAVPAAPYISQPSDRVVKPYERHETPLFRKLDIPMGIPFPDFNPGPLPVPNDAPPGPPQDIPQNAGAGQPDQIGRVGDKVVIPTFSLQDPDLDDKHAPRLVSYDVNSPEAKLYLENLQSIVKITVQKAGPDGKPMTAVGTGFFVTEDGEIATANHVIDGATSIRIQTPSGWAYEARVKESHSPSEAAVLELVNKTPGEKFRPIPLRDTAADLRPTDKLTVLGHPNGVDDVVMSTGNFLSRERSAGSGFTLQNLNPNAMFLHADARIQGGNSGGPILDSEGRAVGITNFKHDDKTGEFLGIDEVRSLVTDPIKGRLSDQRSYVVPSTLQLDSDMGWKGWETFMSGANAANAYVGRAYNNQRLTATTRGFASVVVGSVAIGNMPKDYRAFKSSLEFGSTAERVSAGIDLGGDVLMAGGSLAAIASRRFAVVGTTISTIGAGGRFANALFGDRRYH